MLPSEQPQGLCDLIGLSFRIWRRNLPLIFRVLILPTILYFAATGVLQWCLTWGISNMSDLPKIIMAVAAGLAAILVFFVALIWLSIQQLALVRLFNGFAPDWQKALAYARKKFLVMLGLFGISVVLSSVVMLIWFCILGLAGAVTATGPAGAILGSVGILFAVVGMFISVSMLMLVCLMGFSVLACEETTFFGVIGRAFNWTFKHFGRVLCFGFMFYVIFSVVSIPVSLPVIAVSVGDMFVNQIQNGAAASSTYRASLGVMLLIQFWEGLCSLLLRPVTVICFGLFYLDLRRRSDGLDLLRKLKELNESTGGAENGIQGH
jgi:hypothetical protein